MHDIGKEKLSKSLHNLDGLSIRVKSIIFINLFESYIDDEETFKFREPSHALRSETYVRDERTKRSSFKEEVITCPDHKRKATFRESTDTDIGLLIS